MKDRTTINSLFSNDPSGSGGQTKRSPCLEILYHYDLERIGLVATPKEFDLSRELRVGRGKPDFWPVALSPELNADKVGLGLDDPCVSRDHFGLSWHGAFYEIKPEMGKRPLQLWPVIVDVDGNRIGYAHPFRIDRPVQAAPGSLLSIGDRVLLMLDYRPTQDPRADRMGIIGESLPVWQVRDEIIAVSRLQRPVWLHGETGVGKELVASAIHRLSERRSNPFKVINCGAIPENLVESVFFGHQKGAFTGASNASAGMFRDADEGSLLLDEIGELPLDMQQKLLRVLQSGTLMPVGSTRETQVNVRVIAATWRDLEEEVAAGRFRADLFYRLSVHIIRIPALRQRRDDIPRLFLHFLRRRRAEYRELNRLFRDVEASAPPVPMDFFIELITNEWSGNVRQLENVVEKLVQFNLHDGPFTPPKWQAMPGSSTLPLPQAQPTPRSTPRITSRAAPTTAPYPAIAGPPTGSVPYPGAAVSASAAPAFPSTRTSSPEDQTALVDQVLHRIGLTRPTAIKLLGEVVYTQACVQFNLTTGSEMLSELLTDSLQVWLERYDYNQTHTAQALDVSRMTLIRAMGNLGFVRPKELSSDEINAALAHVGGDIQQAARNLRVSARGLQRRINQLNKA